MMARLSSLLLALAAGRTLALPTQQDSQPEKSSGGFLSNVGKLTPLLGAMVSGNKLTFQGTPEATDTFIAMAKLMGATRDKPGTFRAYTMKTRNPGYGLVPDPPGVTVPRKQILESRTGIPGVQTVKIRYGPYSVPNMGKKNGVGEEGMLSNYPAEKMQKPCDGDCTIIGMESGLEYPDGKSANIDTGMWLHHIVLFNKGEGRNDPTCADRDVSLPHTNIAATPRNSERIFASGNERTVASLPEWGVKDVGYKIRATDEFAALLELMNENMEDKIMYFTMTYDILPGHPYKDDLKILWFDIRNCGTSEVSPPENQNKFTLSANWTSTLDAEVLGAIGHGHDGTVRTNMYVDHAETCENIALYGTKPAFVQTVVMPGALAEGATSHISEQKPCYGDKLPLKTMKKGQVWTNTADYDFDAHKGMKTDEGGWDAVMGIQIVFVRLKN